MPAVDPNAPCPELRRGLAAGREHRANHFVLWDNQRFTQRVIRLTGHEISWAQQFTGQGTFGDLQARVSQHTGGMHIALEDLADLAERLDQALLLNSTRFADYIMGRDRDPSCIGCYSADPDVMRRQLAALFTGPGGPGLPQGPPPKSGSLRAVLAPHMDYGRGGATYGWAFKELFERTSARLFVIIGTSHFSPARFSLSKMNYRTPLGVVETDQGYVERITREYGEEAFADPLAHLPEHSIELEVALMQFLYETHRPFRIVPLLVGSFFDTIGEESVPDRKEDITRMVTALRAAEAAADEEVCYVISGDLAHIGPKFEDPEPVHAVQLAHSKRQDEAIMDRAKAVDAAQYFATIAAERDERRICGLPPTWTTLMAAKPSRGRLLHYQQYVHPEGFESVSFASMAFDK